MADTLGFRSTVGRLREGLVLVVTELARSELRRASPGRPTALTIGVFDGVHRGHQIVLKHVVESARQHDLAAAAITFHPHPRQVLRPDLPTEYVTSLEDRLSLILETGLDSVATVSFTSDFSLTDAGDFVRMLVEEFHLARLIIGEDFALGRQRGGDPDTLKALGQELGYEVEVIELLTSDSTDKVSSTEIRNALAEGDVTQVGDLLGRRYSLHGPVVVGFKRGRSIGFATANVAIGNDRAIPAPGVYATIAHLEAGPTPSVTNIGMRPTFDDGGGLSIECHIIDFDEDIYGTDLRVEFVQRLRGERKFGGVDELVEQIGRDRDAARELLAAMSTGS
ncbi:MAG: bifunctional riboflavin kinase/FAD synthetase [Chloroflexota bacterium]|nr:bifunctional riboflavin kinase/FAD synthetase [Chloroflexota bacterium]MDE2894103.1 bifunctional riboflavin kinase/FAD synthetase [Chloroflexota bacterium]